MNVIWYQASAEKYHDPILKRETGTGRGIGRDQGKTKVFKVLITV
jgi:hypothetical protein